MKKLILIIFVLIFLQITASSQNCLPCLPAGITFNTQNQIDSFQINNPGCTEIEGDVEIYGNDITNVNGLSVLTSIGGSLDIGSYYSTNSNLLSLSGLEGLTSIGGHLRIFQSVYLTSLTGLDNVTSIGGALFIWNNHALTSLTGLDNVTSIEGGFEIGNAVARGNPSLTSLTGLENVTSIGGGLRIEYNDTLTSLTGLDNVTSIEGHLFMNNNDALTSLAGLNNVTSIGGDLLIYSHNALTSLTGLDNATSIGGILDIWNNNDLLSLTGLDNVTSIGGVLRIGGNNTLTSLTGLGNLTSIGGELSIAYNDALTNLSGLDNIDVASIEDLYIYENDSLSNCEVQNVCDYLVSPTGSVNIYNNASGCNNPIEVANGCGITLPCLPFGNYYFVTQADIENFQTNYPNCTEIEGDVRIEGDDITNLNGLNVLTAIEGDLMIFYTDYLTRLTGLDNVTSIGRDLRIVGNDTLTNLTDLDNVTSIGGALKIGFNDILTSLTGLENVTSIGGYIYIPNNDALTSLKGLDNIDAGTITDLILSDNPLLSTCEVQSICDYLSSPSGTISIHNNTTGCNSQQEVEEACDTLSVENLTIDDGFLIYPNPVKERLTISSKNGLRIYEIAIYNQIGQKVLHHKPAIQPIDVSMLRQGLYVIEVVCGNRKMRGKFIK